MTTHAGGEPCPCGRNGCFERYASQTALERLAGGLEAGQVIARAQAGEPLMAAAFHRYLDELCVGLSSLIALFHPQMTVLGGALSHAGPYLLGSVRRHMQLPGMMSRGEPVPRIELSVLGQRRDAHRRGADGPGTLARKPEPINLRPPTSRWPRIKRKPIMYERRAKCFPLRSRTPRAAQPGAVGRYDCIKGRAAFFTGGRP